MGRNKGPKFYAVFRGRERGVFDTWGVAEKLVKGYPRAKHQSFTTRQDAEAWLRDEEAKEKGKARDHQGQDIAHAGGHGFIASARAHTYRNSRSHHGASVDPRTYQNSGANSNPGTHYKPDANQQVRLPGSRAKWPGPAFAVFKGHNPGVYRNCADAEEQVEDFPEYEIQEFASRDEAWQWFQGRQAEEDSQNQKRKRSEHTREMAESSESATKRIRPSLNEQDFVPLDDGQSDFSDAYSDETSEDGISGPRRKSNRNNRVLEELPPLCAEQQDVVDLVVQRKNIFTTGSAGCGKSTLLKHIVRRLDEEDRPTDIVAPTGIAALNVGGTTAYTYAGWNPNFDSLSLKKLHEEASGKKVWKRLNKTSVLIIDEISMISSNHFRRLNKVMQEARGSKKPFGGVQLVVMGDFCQLPPVKAFEHCWLCGKILRRFWNQNEVQSLGGRANRYWCSCQCDETGEICVDPCPSHGWYDEKDRWAFQTPDWAECHFINVHLTTIHRQSDERFIKVLQAIRLGLALCSEDERLLLNHPSETDKAVKLRSRRDEVQKINHKHYIKLQTTPYTYHSVDYIRRSDRYPEISRKMLAEELKHGRYEEVLNLKEGMAVILLCNLDVRRGLVNGSQGTIVGFTKFEDVEKPRAAQPGEGYDTPSPRGAVLFGDHTHLRVKEIEEYMDTSHYQAWPIVQFVGVKDPVEVYADCTVNTKGDEEPKAVVSRTQIPLMAGWAITIHRSQGMTLDQVDVDLSSTFEAGQAYVALSRARTLDGLKITSSNLGKLPGGWIDDQVRQFYERTFPKEMEAMRQRHTRVNVPTRRPQKTLQEMWKRPNKEAEKETKVEVREEAQVSTADVPSPVRAAVRF